MWNAQFKHRRNDRDIKRNLFCFSTPNSINLNPRVFRKVQSKNKFPTLASEPKRAVKAGCDQPAPWKPCSWVALRSTCRASQLAWLRLWGLSTFLRPGPAWSPSGRRAARVCPSLERKKPSALCHAPTLHELMPALQGVSSTTRGHGQVICSRHDRRTRETANSNERPWYSIPQTTVSLARLAQTGFVSMSTLTGALTMW